MMYLFLKGIFQMLESAQITLCIFLRLLRQVHRLAELWINLQLRTKAETFIKQLALV